MNLIEVKKGNRVQFINHKHDYFMEAFLIVDREEGSANGYKIMLNGKLAGSFKAYQPFSKKCRALITEWQLEEY